MSLKRYLQLYSKEELIEQILDLNRKYKEVKTHYDFILKPNDTAQLEKVKKTITRLMNNMSRGPRLQDARKELSAFKKSATRRDWVAEVMLHYIDCGIAFINTYGDGPPALYDSIGNMFYDVCKFVIDNGLESEYKDKCYAMKKATGGIGYGVSFATSDHYRAFFGA